MIESFGAFRTADPIDEALSNGQLKQLEKYLDDLFKELNVDVNFSKHFLERVNDVRNKDEPITLAQLRNTFRENMREHKSQIKGLHDNEDAHFLKVSERLNIPFTIKRDAKGELDLVAKTVVRRSPDWVKRAKPKDGGKVMKVD